ncbi:MAG: hypothetical protein OXI46_01385 [Gemmatimonadota bacterium]|nr:hypothetical protein [Gemmatimonadota bacterium]
MSGDQALEELERMVDLALEELDRLRRRAAEADRRCAELEALLSSFRVGEEDPVATKARLTRLEAESQEMKARIEQGREGVERLLSRIRFLEDQQP